MDSPLDVPSGLVTPWMLTGAPPAATVLELVVLLRVGLASCFADEVSCSSVSLADVLLAVERGLVEEIVEFRAITSLGRLLQLA